MDKAQVCPRGPRRGSEEVLPAEAGGGLSSQAPRGWVSGNISFRLSDAAGPEELVFPAAVGGLAEVRGGVIRAAGSVMKSFAERQFCSDLSVFPHDFIPRQALLGSYF